MADEIINARVKQKVDSEENWLANPLILLEGEQGFVWKEGDPNQPVNFKIGDGTRAFADLPYFIAYYSNVISHKIIRLPNVSVQQVIPSIFLEGVNLYDVVITNVSGTDTVLKIGFTDGGSEIGEYNIGAGNTILDLKYVLESSETLYISWTGAVELSIIIIYFNYDESPAIPPGGEATPFRWPKGFTGMFVPIGVGHLEQCFDMITGLGVVGSAYENCQLCNASNIYLNMEDTYPIGYKTGVTIGQQVGSNTTTIAKANLPVMDLTFTIWGIVFQRGSSGNRLRWITGIGSNNDNKMPDDTGTAQQGGYPGTASIPLGGSGTAIDNRPKSKYILYFTAKND